MFDNVHYVSRSVTNRFGIEIQNLLWLMIDGMDVSVKDRLQTFILSIEDEKQKIIHIQEHSDYRKGFSFHCDKPKMGKIHVIDNGECSTMILANEDTKIRQL